VLDSDGNAMDPAFLYGAPAAVALAKESPAETAADGRQAVTEVLTNATEDTEEASESKVANEIEGAGDPLAAAAKARDAAQRAEESAVNAQRAAERTIEALQSGRNETWMAAMWQANKALNFMKRTDFRLATSHTATNAPVPWRVQAAEAARSAAAPYMEVQRHYAETVPQLQRAAALEARRKAEELRREADELKTKALVLRNSGDLTAARLTDAFAQKTRQSAAAQEQAAEEHLKAAELAVKKAKDEGYAEQAQEAADDAVQNLKLPVRYQRSLPPDPLRHWKPTAASPLP